MALVLVPTPKTSAFYPKSPNVVVLQYYYYTSANALVLAAAMTMYYGTDDHGCVPVTMTSSSLVHCAPV